MPTVADSKLTIPHGSSAPILLGKLGASPITAPEWWLFVVYVSCGLLGVGVDLTSVEGRVMHLSVVIVSRWHQQFWFGAVCWIFFTELGCVFCRDITVCWEKICSERLRGRLRGGVDMPLPCR